MKAIERRNVLANKALKDKSIGVDDICAYFEDLKVHTVPLRCGRTKRPAECDKMSG